MAQWIIPVNEKTFDYEEAFDSVEYIGWCQNAKYQVGDEVFIYCSKPEQRVRYKTLVEKTNLTADSFIYCDKFWRDKNMLNNKKNSNFICLKLIKQVKCAELTLTELQKHGLNGPIQSPRRISDKLLSYINQYFENDEFDNISINDENKSYYPDEFSSPDRHEGACKKVYVNKYERDPKARQCCINHHGCKCFICGMNFEDVYGDIGKGFIHVHHIIPLNKIGKNYLVDGKKDLIPVCPNCHAMLHRAINGHEITIDELKDRIEARRFTTPQSKTNH